MKPNISGLAGATKKVQHEARGVIPSAPES